VKRRDLLLGGVALLGSAVISGGGAAYALNTYLPQAIPTPPPLPEPAATPEAVAVRGASATPAAGHGAVEDHAAPATAPHWDYEGAMGPPKWAALDSANVLCGVGGAQSPIDLANALRVPALPGLSLSYGSTRVKVANNGHTFQVNVDKGSSLTIDGKKFELVQFHFHTPSEHTVDGRNYPMELHLVHQAADKSLAVIGVLLSEGNPSTVLTKFWERLPKTIGEVDTGATIQLQDLLPRNIDDYFTYSGSLTTPPCTESVRWIVLKRPVDISKSQAAAFRAVFPLNARPVQPIGARLLLSS
jgi:carbonic anhydrase